MVLLTAENIRKSYGTRVIFDDISFSIHEGDKIGVIGVNGTGKSTLLKIIAGVDQADSGSIVTMNGDAYRLSFPEPRFCGRHNGAAAGVPRRKSAACSGARI